MNEQLSNYGSCSFFEYVKVYRRSLQWQALEISVFGKMAIKNLENKRFRGFNKRRQPDLNW